MRAVHLLAAISAALTLSACVAGGPAAPLGLAPGGAPTAAVSQGTANPGRAPVSGTAILQIVQMSL